MRGIADCHRYFLPEVYLTMVPDWKKNIKPGPVMNLSTENSLGWSVFRSWVPIKLTPKWWDPGTWVYKRDIKQKILQE